MGQLSFLLFLANPLLALSLPSFCLVPRVVFSCRPSVGPSTGRIISYVDHKRTDRAKKTAPMVPRDSAGALRACLFFIHFFSVSFRFSLIFRVYVLCELGY